MNCTDREDNLYLLAAGALDSADRAELQVHLATGCPTCSGVHAVAVATMGQFVLGAVDLTVGPSSGALARLTRRVDQLDGAGASDGVQLAERERLMIRPDPAARAVVQRGFKWRAIALAASVAALLTAGPMFLYQRAHASQASEQLAVASREFAAAHAEVIESNTRLASAEKMLADIQTALTAVQKERSDLVAQNKNLSDDLVSLRTDLAATQQVAQMLASKQLMMLDLKGMPGAPAGENAQARLLVDLQHKIWRLYTADLKPVPNRVFEFWLVTADGKKVPMGSFKTDEKGQGVLTGDVPDPMPALAMAAITDEPGPGAKEPTGTMHVVGKFQ